MIIQHPPSPLPTLPHAFNALAIDQNPEATVRPRLIPPGTRRAPRIRVNSSTKLIHGEPTWFPRNRTEISRCIEISSEIYELVPATFPAERGVAARNRAAANWNEELRVLRINERQSRARIKTNIRLGARAVVGSPRIYIQLNSFTSAGNGRGPRCVRNWSARRPAAR